MERKIDIQLSPWVYTVFFALMVCAIVFIENYCQRGVPFCKMIIVAVFMLSLFIVSAVVLYKSFKINVENNEKQKEFERKKEWETFQHSLYKEEREEKWHYDAIKALIEKLDDKEIKEEFPLKKEVETLKTDLAELKKEKDKKYFVEFVNSLKSKK
ncbi:MAG: hypothetical protein LBU57_08930 [Dysgonamonadaceae bacterium]|jgi:hypothetical protein|nr:hypothetical protein [Dysgonamonadaceae bacterium]